jgi:ABC-type transport system involved in multi-copper enzyme maturation permease subunit
MSDTWFWTALGAISLLTLLVVFIAARAARHAAGDDGPIETTAITMVFVPMAIVAISLIVFFALLGCDMTGFCR